MSLKSRLDSVQPSLANRGCHTCLWIDTLGAADRQAFDAWLAEGKSVAQLWEICTNEGLAVSCSPFRAHLRHHKKAE